MGDELWNSPITGYRRKGTRLAELRSLLGAGITAYAILEPLQSCPADAVATDIAEVLRQKDFDVAGVQCRSDGPVIGSVARHALIAGLVSDHIRPITADTLISDATPLPSVLTVMKGRPHTFVLIGAGVRGIITRTDLNKPPVRVYLFGLISLLEMHLAFWIRSAYPNDSWQGELAPKRLDAAKKLQDLRRKRTQDVSLAECLQFCDKRDLLLASKDLREKLDLRSKVEVVGLLTRAEDLRNLLAHSHHYLTKGSSWEEVIALVEWVESFLHMSDQRVEVESQKATGRDVNVLWASA